MGPVVGRERALYLHFSEWAIVLVDVQEKDVGSPNLAYLTI